MLLCFCIGYDTLPYVGLVRLQFAASIIGKRTLSAVGTVRPCRSCFEERRRSDVAALWSAAHSMLRPKKEPNTPGIDIIPIGKIKKDSI